MDCEKEKCAVENNICSIYSYNLLNAEFQRITRRDKKAFNEQCKEIEKKIEWKRLDISPRKFSVSREYFMQVGKVKDRNGKDLTEAEQIGRDDQNTLKN